MFRSPTSILSLKTVLQGVAATVLTAAIVVPAVLTHSAAVAETRSSSSPSPATHHKPTYADIVRDQLDTVAEQTYAGNTQALAGYAGAVDTTAAAQTVTALVGHEKLPDAAVQARIDAANAAVAQVAAQVAAQKAAEALRVANTPDGAKATARSIMASDHGWGDDQFQCLSSLWQKESGWSYTASNGSSGAAGIPQALPGSKMATAGADWQTSAATQITWGLDYIARSYGTPCAAWSHSESVNWY